jgi:hypothetical protein
MRPDPLASPILDSIDAYGGLERWRTIDEMVVFASAGGTFLSVKHQGKAIRNIQAHISPARQHVVFVPYPDPGKRGVFDAGIVRIESDRGDVIAERSDARNAFRGLRHQLCWDKLDVLYFCGYALWTYLTLPFILAGPGFEVRELEPWEEGDEIWQRIGVRFPSEIHTHCREQTLYLDQRGLVRRLSGFWESAPGWLPEPLQRLSNRRSGDWFRGKGGLRTAVHHHLHHHRHRLQTPPLPGIKKKEEIWLSLYLQRWRQIPGVNARRA